MKKAISISMLFMLAFAFASCEANFKPNEYVFSEVHELEGVMVYAADKAFYGEVVTPGLSIGFCTCSDTTYFVYQHFDEDYPCNICGEDISYLDTIRVLARTAEAKDYNKSTYYCIDIVKVLGIKHSTEEKW